MIFIFVHALVFSTLKYYENMHTLPMLSHEINFLLLLFCRIKLLN